MSKYVPDISTRRWVIVSPQRLGRPDHNGHSEKHDCPFCNGSEALTPPELYRIGKGEPNTPGWKVRVIPNKFPITDVHEVVIHSPDHKADIEDLSLGHVELIISTYRQRYNFHRKDGQVLIFCNHGEHAGASLTHPHSQIVVIPKQINLETLSREPLNNIVEETPFFNVYCPDFSQWPYEIWVSSKKEGTLFGDMTDEEVRALSQILQKLIRRLKKIYEDRKISKMPFGYNFYFFPKESWYVRIIPRFVHRAGFELGTGLYVNVVDPMEAALELKGVEKRVRGVLEKLRKY